MGKCVICHEEKQTSDLFVNNIKSPVCTKCYLSNKYTISVQKLPICDKCGRFGYHDGLDEEYIIGTDCCGKTLCIKCFLGECPEPTNWYDIWSGDKICYDCKKKRDCTNQFCGPDEMSKSVL